MTSAPFQPPRISDVLPEMETREDAVTSGIEFEGGANWAIRSGWFSGGLSDRVQVVELCNGPLKVWVLPTRGMGIWGAECNGIPVGWNSPVRRPVHPAFINLNSRNGLGWLDGFNELICRCGLSFNGPPGSDEGAASPVDSAVTLHGRIANTPAHAVMSYFDRKGLLQIRGTVDEATLFGPNLQLVSTVSTTPGSHRFHVRDEVTNHSSRPAELQLLYHTNVGPPFLEEGSSLLCPATLVVPRDPRAAEGIGTWQTYLGPTAGYAEQAYFLEMLADERGHTVALLTDRNRNRGFSVRYKPQQLPCFTQWKCTQAEEDGYVTGLEPGTNYPNFKGFERRQGRLPLLGPGQTYAVELEFEVHCDAEAVRFILDEINDLHGPRTPQVLPVPTAPYCNVE